MVDRAASAQATGDVARRTRTKRGRPFRASLGTPTSHCGVTSHGRQAEPSEHRGPRGAQLDDRDIVAVSAEPLCGLPAETHSTCNEDPHERNSRSRKLLKRLSDPDTTMKLTKSSRCSTDVASRH